MEEIDSTFRWCGTSPIRRIFTHEPETPVAILCTAITWFGCNLPFVFRVFNVFSQLQHPSGIPIFSRLEFTFIESMMSWISSTERYFSSIDSFIDANFFMVHLVITVFFIWFNLGFQTLNQLVLSRQCKISCCPHLPPLHQYLI